MTTDQANGLIADNIVRLRQQHRLSQDDVAFSLQAMGINLTRGRLSMIETKKRPPSALLLVGLKLVFGCEYGDFFREIEDQLAPNLKVYRKKNDK